MSDEPTTATATPETPPEAQQQPRIISVEEALGIAPQGTITEEDLREDDHLMGELRRLVGRWQRFGLNLAQERQRQQQAPASGPSMAPETERELRDQIKALQGLEVRLKNELELAHKELTALRSEKEDRTIAETATELLTGKKAQT
jgi:hypothetical protein